MGIEITSSDRLASEEREAVVALAGQVEQHDGAPPLSDQALTQLASGATLHLLARADGALVGYAQLAGRSLEIAARADAADALLAAALERQGDPLVWSHGTRTPVGAALERRGFVRVRVLHQLRRDARLPLPEAAVPDGVAVRPFVVGLDESEWVRVNAAAFAHHPEQGAWTVDDVRAREAEAWFDPDGFLLAERAGVLLGFHWTKVHPDGVGEVYVLGVDPAAQGLRLGAALLVSGLRLLAERGCPEVLLYVDDDNTAAMHLYAAMGFANHDTDIQWRRPGGGS